MIKETRKEYLENKCDKFEYMGRMHSVHKILYEYADYIKNTDAVDITIRGEEVYYTFLSGGTEIKMVCIPHDVTSVPFTFLDFGSYERDETEFVMDLVKEKDVVLDIGANLGWFTLNWLKRFKKITVFSFEPMPDTYKKLVQNLKINGHKTRNAFNYGLSNRNTEAVFYWDTERCGASAMVNLRDTDKTVRIKCKVKRLDDVFLKLGVKKLDFIKCDVEGAEKLVFDGGKNTISKYKPVIFTEMLRKWSKKFNYHPNDIIQMMAGMGYSCYVIVGRKLKEFGKVTEDTVETNYLFLDKIKHAKILSKYGRK
ncbi:MAG: FkbM family methyltransferase [Endomicrobiales bacterium]|nr:FkbM family methyltransferase [Endomicrobiales bacterium]